MHWRTRRTNESNQMAKADPKRALQYATTLMFDGLDRKTFDAAMRTEFPQITDYMLHQTWQDAKIMLAIQHSYQKDTNHDDT